MLFVFMPHTRLGAFVTKKKRSPHHMSSSNKLQKSRGIHSYCERYKLGRTLPRLFSTAKQTKTSTNKKENGAMSHLAKVSMKSSASAIIFVGPTLSPSGKRKANLSTFRGVSSCPRMGSSF